MQLDVQLEPLGKQAESVMANWQRDQGLSVSGHRRVEIAPEDCLAALADLRDRCYDRGLVVNVNFTGRSA